MKKTILPIVLMSALFVAVSCSKSLDPSEEEIVFTGTIENTTLFGSKVNWVQDDAISINGVKYLATPKTGEEAQAYFYKSDVKADPSSPYYVYYPDSIYDGATATLPATQTYDAANPSSINPMYAYADEANGVQSVNFSFKNICGTLKLILKHPRCVNTITVESSTEPVCGPFTVENNAAKMATSGTGKTIILNCGGAYASEFYIPLPPQKYTNLTVTIVGMGFSVSKSLSGQTIARNTMYSTSTIDVAEAGKFSVAGGKQVVFSQGNLYCKRTSGKTSDWTWHFYDQQYQHNSLSKLSERTATRHDTEIDLFTWGYGDWSTDPTTSSYNTGTSPLSVSDGTDWGTLMGSGWYTLSSYEWQYLLGLVTPSRTNASKLYKSEVKVCGQYNCLIIAPDGYDYTTYPLQGVYNTESSEDYPLTWEQAEAQGLVCLPSSGNREGSSIGEADIHGYYWSSTPSSNYAYSFIFTSDYIRLESEYRTGGFSVRLVQ